MDDLDAARIQEDSARLVATTGTTRLLLRQPMQPSLKVGDAAFLDQDYKVPTMAAEQIPYRERTIVAKVRSINDHELASTGVGELQIGDLVAFVDPRYFDDALQPVSTLDEIRFEQMTTLPTGTISSDWDYIVHGVHPSWIKDVCVGLKLILRRKQVKTPSGGGLEPV
jgi:hypothetical protein